MPDHYFVFTIQDRSYAIRLSAVEKVVRAAELIFLPDKPEGILGLINLRGKSIPVVNIRRYFRLPDREIELEDRIVICRTHTHMAAFMADAVEGVVIFTPDRLDAADQIFPEMEQHISGVGRIKEKSVIICDIRRLLSGHECTRDPEGGETPPSQEPAPHG